MYSAILTIAGVTVTVEYEIIKPHRGARDSLGGVAGAGQPLEPDEKAGIEIQSITSEEDITELLSSKIIESIEEKVTDSMNEEEE